MHITQNIKVAVDAVVFGYTEGKLKILLIQQKYGANANRWALPGGFVKDNESLDDSVVRELKEESGITANYLEQLYTFGAVGRDSRSRVITVGYIALINPKNYLLKADTDAKDVNWFSIDEIPNLAYDHEDIIEKGIERLQSKIKYQPIGFELLENKFPFSELENLYQTILNKKVDRRNFRKKLLSFGILRKTDDFIKIGSGRPARLFSFNRQKYKELGSKGFYFEIHIA